MSFDGPEDLASKRIESRANAALSGAPELTREWVAQDIQDFNSIQSPDLARFAAVTITENLDNPAYSAEFNVQSAELAERVKTLYEQNASMSWIRDESDSLGHAFNLLEQEDQAKRWSPSEAKEQAKAALVKFQDINKFYVSPTTQAYEQEMQIADMARNAMVSKPFRDALLEAANPEIAEKVSGHPVRPAADFMNATFVGKIVAISSAHLEMKIGRDPSNTMALPRSGLTGDAVQVGQVATIQFTHGRGQVNNHEVGRTLEGVGR